MFGGASELRWQQLKGLGTPLSVSRQETTFPKSSAAVLSGYLCHCFGAHLLQESVQMSWSSCNAK